MKVSGTQLFWIMFCFQVHYALNQALRYGKQDAWIICLLSGAAAMILTYIIAKVSLLSPDETLVVYCQRLLGKWIGKGIMLIYLLAWFMLTASTLREWSDYVYLKLLPNTPVLMVVLPMTLLAIYAILKGGITAIGRCSQIIGPLYFLISFGPIFLMFGIMDWTNLLPVYADTGWRNIVRGAVPTLADTMRGAMMPLMLVAFNPEPKKATKWALWAIGLSSLWVIIASTASVLIAGPHLAPQLTLPWVVAIRSVSILDFIQNVDAFAVFVYAFSHFIAFSSGLFVTGYGFAQWFDSKHWKRSIWVVVVLVFLCVAVTSKLGHITNLFRQSVWVPWVLPIHMIGIPLFLLFVGTLKRRQVSSGSS